MKYYCKLIESNIGNRAQKVYGYFVFRAGAEVIYDLEKLIQFCVVCGLSAW